MKIILYTGPHCELCEHALDLINQLETPVSVEKINIRESTELYHLYGARIPVIRKVTNSTNGVTNSKSSVLSNTSLDNATNNPASIESQVAHELGWPFSLIQLKAFLA